MNVVKTVWYTFTPASRMALTINARNTNFGVVVAVYTGDSVGALTPVACGEVERDAFSGGASAPLVRLTVAAGTTYRIQVGGTVFPYSFSPQFGNVDVHFTTDAVPIPSPAPAPPLRCTSRPNVGLVVVPIGAGRLQVTISAMSSDLLPSNQLRELRFGAATNAVVDVPNAPTGSPGSITVPLPAGAGHTGFVVRRVTPGAFTVPLEVVDGCGAWPTFVGGGVNVP